MPNQVSPTQFYIPTQGQQQQQQQGINPLQALQAYQTFSGGGGGLSSLIGGGGATGAGAGTGAAAGGAGASGAAAGGGASTGAGTALASNPVGWIVAAALAQNVAHNKGISSWQSALKGQSGGNIGTHFLDQWGVDKDSPARDVAGVLGWEKKGGGIFNPNYLSRKIFGDVD